MEGHTRAFVTLKKETPLADISDLVTRLGGRMHASFGRELMGAEILGATVSIPDERLPELKAYEGARRVYTGPIPRSTMRGYTESGRSVARQWNNNCRADEPRYGLDRVL